MLNEKEVSRFPRSSEEGNSSLSGRSIPLLRVTLCTGADEILPRVLSSAILRDDVIHSHRSLNRTAVLALVVVPLGDVLPVQKNPFSGNVDHPAEAYDAGKGDRRADRVDPFVIPLDHLGFFEIEKNNRPPGAANARRFVVLIQNQNPTFQHRAIPFITKFNLKIYNKIIK